jgi:hypothetical protein
MSETIFLLNSGGELVEMNEETYLTEALLQKLLSDYPALISGSQINPGKPRRWLLISREFGVPDDTDAGQRWSLDHLFIDQDGIPTLVEVKRSTDTRIRREVIGQILDYAANAVSYWTIEEIKHRFEENCKELNEEPGIVINNFLQGEIEAEGFWETTKTNLKAGKIRLLIIADTIPKELQRIIEFLNEQMASADILGIEIKQFVGQDLKTLVPRVIGMTSNAQTVKGRSPGNEENWTEEAFFKELLNQRGEQETEAVRKIVDWIRPKVTYIWFGIGKTGSLVPILKTKDDKKYCFSIWPNGDIEIYFQYMKNQPPFDIEEKRIELLNRLNSINGVSLSRERISGRPRLQVSLLKDKEEMQKFFDAFNWYWSEQMNPRTA